MKIGTQIKPGQWQLTFTVPDPVMRDIMQTMLTSPMTPTISAFLREMVRRGLLSWKQEMYRDNSANRPARIEEAKRC